MYWANTGSYDAIKRVMKKSIPIKKKLLILLNGGTIEEKIKEGVTFEELDNSEDNAWTILLSTGYLKIVERVDEDYYRLAIPNHEIKKIFNDIVLEWFNENVIDESFDELISNLIKLEFEEFIDMFQSIVLSSFSYMDLGKKKSENFYHAFVLGMLVSLKDKYYVKSNRESGRGRYDITMEPVDKTKPAFVMEFKVFNEKRDKDIDDTIRKGKEQIEEKKYDVELKERGCKDIYKMVFAFDEKDVTIEHY